MKRMQISPSSRRWDRRRQRILLADVLAIALFTAVIIFVLFLLCALTWVIS